MQFAPRLSPRLLDVIEKHAGDGVPIAEINRRVGSRAERLGLPRPSYQRVRVLVHEARTLREAYVPTTDILVDIAMRARSPYALTELHTLAPRSRLRDRVSK